MAVSTKDKICAHCGADVRAGSLFCYGCGSSVAPETVVALKDKNEFGGKPSVSQTLENGAGKTTKLKESNVENFSGKPIVAPMAAKDSELKSAASMRRKSKIYQQKRTEIVWEERGSSANVWFILAAIILTLLAVGIFYLAIYLK